MILTQYSVNVSFCYIKFLAQSGCSGNAGSLKDYFYILHLSWEKNELREHQPPTHVILLCVVESGISHKQS